MTENSDIYDALMGSQEHFSSTTADEIIPYIIHCHADSSHSLCFKADPHLQAVEIADVVLEKMRTLSGGRVGDMRNSVREALNHLLMTHPLVSQYFAQ